MGYWLEVLFCHLQVPFRILHIASACFATQQHSAILVLAVFLISVVPRIAPSCLDDVDRFLPPSVCRQARQRFRHSPVWTQPLRKKRQRRLRHLCSRQSVARKMVSSAGDNIGNVRLFNEDEFLVGRYDPGKNENGERSKKIVIYLCNSSVHQFITSQVRFDQMI
jgi:hypothetical protein